MHSALRRPRATGKAADVLHGFGFAGQNNPTRGLLHMLRSAMQKQPETFTRKFNAVFTTSRLIVIIGLLMGILFARMLGA